MSSTTAIKWTATRDESEAISQIAKRARKLAKKLADVEIHAIDFVMDVEAAHCNGCRLELRRLLQFPDADFGHDVFGIRRHINRETGQLENCFVPRCAAQSTEAAQ